MIFSDSFHIGVDPATVLCRITLQLRLDNFYLRSATGPSWIGQQEAKDRVTSLLRITKKGDFLLRITLGQSIIRLNPLEEFLAIVHPAIQT